MKTLLRPLSKNEVRGYSRYSIGVLAATEIQEGGDKRPPIKMSAETPIEDPLKSHYRPVVLQDIDAQKCTRQYSSSYTVCLLKQALRLKLSGSI